MYNCSTLSDHADLNNSTYYAGLEVLSGGIQHQDSALAAASWLQIDVDDQRPAAAAAAGPNQDPRAALCASYEYEIWFIVLMSRVAVPSQVAPLPLRP